MSNKKKITIVCEGSTKIGLGHIFRSKALFQVLQPFFHLHFLVVGNLKESVLIGILDNIPFETCTLETLSSQLGVVADSIQVIILDFFAHRPEIVHGIKQMISAKIVLMGCSNTARNDASLVINVAETGNYHSNIHLLENSIKTKILEGPKFIIFRSDFYKRKQIAVFPKKFKKLLIGFGGSDPANLSKEVIKIINAFKLDDAYSIQLILGNGYQFKEQILAYQKEYSVNIQIILSATNIPELIHKTDIVLTSPGNMLFESIFLNKPALAFYQNEKQLKDFQQFPFTYSSSSLKTLPTLLKEITQNQAAIKSYHKEIEVGMGKKEIIENIKLLVK